MRRLQDERDIESLGQRAAFSPPLHWHKVAFTGDSRLFLITQSYQRRSVPYVRVLWRGENQSHKHTSFEAAAIPGEIPPPHRAGGGGASPHVVPKREGEENGFKR